MNKTKQVILLVSIIIIAFIIYGRSYAYVYGQGQTDNTSRYIDNDTLKTFQNLDKVFQNLDNGTKWEISQCVHNCENRDLLYRDIYKMKKKECLSMQRGYGINNKVIR
jgi:hypothetical protein